MLLSLILPANQAAKAQATWIVIQHSLNPHRGTGQKASNAMDITVKGPSMEPPLKETS